MKIRNLPETDLARIAPHSDDEKWKKLQQIKDGRPPFSYRGLHKCYSDIFTIGHELLDSVDSMPPTQWPAIERKLRRLCCSHKELEHNKRVAKGLHEFAISKGIVGRTQEFPPLAMDARWRVTYWLPFILNIEERPTAVFVDPRRNMGLSTKGRRFVFSMMQEGIRSAYEDYADVDLAVIRFSDPDGNRRIVKFYAGEGIEFYSREELEKMIASTYAIWIEVLEGRQQDARRQSGSKGSLI